MAFENALIISCDVKRRHVLTVAEMIVQGTYQETNEQKTIGFGEKVSEGSGNFYLQRERLTQT
jgi:hypothetical protein